MCSLHPQQLLLYLDVDRAGFHWLKWGTSEHLGQHTDCNSCSMKKHQQYDQTVTKIQNYTKHLKTVDVLLIKTAIKRSKTIVRVDHRGKRVELVTINLILCNPPTKFNCNSIRFLIPKKWWILFYLDQKSESTKYIIHKPHYNVVAFTSSDLKWENEIHPSRRIWTSVCPSVCDAPFYLFARWKTKHGVLRNA